MAQRDDERFERYSATWPFPVGSWALPAFWIVVVLLAAAFWWFG
jgi:hypothetical protein